MNNEDISYYNSDEFKKLRRSYEEMVKEGRKRLYFDSSQLMDLAEYYIRENKLEKAREAIEYSLLLHPDQPEPFILKARIYLNEGKIERAQEILDHMPAGGDEYDLQLIRAEILARTGKQPEACRQLRQMLSKLSDGAGSYIDGAILLLDNGCTEEAAEFIAEGLARYPGNIELRELKAEYYHQKGEHKRAIELYNSVLDEDAYYTVAWEQLGRLYFDQEEYRRAAECFEFELAIDEEEDYARLMLAHCYFYLQQYKQAMLLYKKLIGHNPQAIVPLYYYAICLSEEGYDKEAYEIFKQIEPKVEEGIDEDEEGSPEAEQLQVNMAISLMKQKKYTQALQKLQRAIEHSPQDQELYILAGHVQLALHKIASAIDSYDRAMDLPGKKPEEVLLSMGMSLLEHEFVEVALFTFKKILSYETSDKQEIYPHLALCCWILESPELTEYLNLSLAQSHRRLFEVFNLPYHSEINDADSFLSLLESDEKRREEEEEE